MIPAPMPSLKRLQAEELAQVATDAERANALDVEHEEAATSARPIVVLTSLVGARSCSVRPTPGNEAAPVAEQDEQEEAPRRPGT